MNKKPFNALTSFTYLSKSLQDSKTQILSKIDERFLPFKKDGTEEDFPRRRSINILSEDECKEIMEELNLFADYLHLTPTQTCVFIALYTNQLENSGYGCETDTISRFYEISTVETIPLKIECEELYRTGYFKVTQNGSSGRRRDTSIKLDSLLEHAIANNEAFALSPQEEVDRYRFCEMVSIEIEKRSAGEFSSMMLFEKIDRLEKEYASLKFVKKVMKCVKDIEERTFFYEVCDDYVSVGESGVEETLADMYEKCPKRFKITTMLMEGTHTLVRTDLVEKKAASFMSRAHVALTTKGKELFLEEDFKALKQQQDEDKSIILPNKIITKKLFFGNELKKEIEFLQESLEEKQFVELQKRLSQKGMSKGVTAIFYGVPGTGKTETVMQLAKATGRKIVHVDISATKTCWYGESEKLVKKIFTKYEEKCKNEKLKPILLFNEADAVFGKRRENVSRSVDQTDNSIQNILLEEMEKLDGIMIATTNLAGNLDEAFERRFLFKIKFDKPTIEAKQSIWKSKMPELSDDDCNHLANQFDFSGGEIDNIVRKFTMQQVLHNVLPNYDLIAELCANEKLVKKGDRKKVGF